jgi:hypothetical protein
MSGAFLGQAGKGESVPRHAGSSDDDYGEALSGLWREHFLQDREKWLSGFQGRYGQDV